MIEQVIEAVVSILGIVLLGAGAFIGLTAWATWYNPDFAKTETRQPKTYITMAVCGLVIYFTFFS
jgi:divalent metal cation (Fe/Co/Zn/Cd) transporter